MRGLWLMVGLALVGCASLQRGGADEREVVELHPGDPTLGPSTAKVRIVLFADFQ